MLPIRFRMLPVTLPVRRKTNSREVRTVLLFYGRWAFLSNLTTALCVYLILSVGVGVLSLLLAFKVAVAGLIWWFQREYGARTLYYYTNRGLTPRQLWGWSMALDGVIFFICIALATIIRLVWMA